MLQLDDLWAGYGAALVLRGVDLVLQEGEIVAVLGRNGVGKTTLVKAVMGLVASESGRIVFEGREVSGLPPYERARAGVGYVPQGRGIFPKLSVEENLLVGLYGQNLGTAAVGEVLIDFPILQTRLRDRGGSLSGGQQQILALARAVALRPKLLLLDEPSEGVQPSIIAELLTSLRRIRERTGVSVLIVEQNLEFAAAAASHGYIMDMGRIVGSLPSTEFLSNQLLHQAYLGRV